MLHCYIDFNIYNKGGKGIAHALDLQWNACSTSEERMRCPLPLTEEDEFMAHRYQKRWVFTWNGVGTPEVPPPTELVRFLDPLVEEGVFQLEVGKKTQNAHYQGRFVLRGPRIGKRKLLSLFADKYDTMNLTVEPEILSDSTSYCIKEDTSVGGPWFIGLFSYKQKQETMTLKLRKWQEQLLTLLGPEFGGKFRDRKVIWVQDVHGGAGKSEFIKYLARTGGEHKLVAKKLPFDNPDRIRSSVGKIAKKHDVDIFMFDFTRTRSESANDQNLFQVVEEIKNSYVVDVMYGNYVETFLPPLFVVIFTNEDIKDYRQYLSADRWVPLAVCSDLSLAYIDTNEMRIPFAQFLEETRRGIQKQK